MKSLDLNQLTDLHVSKELGCFGRGVFAGVSKIIDNERGNGDLGSDVTELNDESEDNVHSLVQRSIVDESSIALANFELFLGNFGESGEEEEDSDRDSKDGDGEVDELNVVERFLVSVGEEVLQLRKSVSNWPVWTGYGMETVKNLLPENFPPSLESTNLPWRQ